MAAEERPRRRRTRSLRDPLVMGKEGHGDLDKLEKEEFLERERKKLAQKELILQRKELEMIEREELIETREKNLSALDELEGLTQEDINLKDDQEPARIPPPSAFPNIIMRELEKSEQKAEEDADASSVKNNPEQ